LTIAAPAIAGFTPVRRWHPGRRDRRMAREPRTAMTVAKAAERSIYTIRGHRVMLDSDLASLYRVHTKVLVQAVRRNAARFPGDFMFRLTADEFQILRSQSVTSKSAGGRRHLPYAFTEQGVAMLSSVLRSAHAVRVNIAIMRTFVRLREFIATHEQIAERLATIERKYDGQFLAVFEAIRELMTPAPSRRRRRIGFQPPAAS
jgi:hypothetical protein